MNTNTRTETIAYYAGIAEADMIAIAEDVENVPEDVESAQFVDYFSVVNASESVVRVPDFVWVPGAFE